MPRTNDPSNILVQYPGYSGSFADLQRVGHLAARYGAHPATAISVSDAFDRYMDGNVEGVLGSLSALVPPAPPTLGTETPSWLSSTFTGVPDWGILKLDDRSFNVRNSLTWTVNPSEVYPYYWSLDPTSDFTTPYTDPSTDPTFNVVDGTYTGGGTGKTHGGFVNVDPSGTPYSTPSWRLMSYTPGTRYAVVSGTVFPADRGVLALLRWPTNTFTAIGPAASTSDILSRCVAAIKLGKGLGDGTACDGEAGGMFVETTSGSPFGYPGRASGQYDLDEIHTGTPRVVGTSSPTPNASAGQVRLLSDPIAFDLAVGGMPILGAGVAGGGTAGNFFAYRMPHLKDYAGMRYVPDAEKPRYLTKIVPALDSGTNFVDAGGYADFDADFWMNQIARFRHRFQVATGVSTDTRFGGSFALVHFKTEAAFEAYVRDGVNPSADDLWSVGLQDWDAPSSVDNLTDSSNNPVDNYHVFRGEVVEDVDGSNNPVLDPASDYSITKNVGWAEANTTTTISGVKHFLPRDVSVLSSDSNTYALTVSPQFILANMWDYSYYSRFASGSPTDPERFYAQTPYPVAVSLSSYAGLTVPVVPPALQAARQRVEVSINALDPGTWPDAYTPIPGTDAELTSTVMSLPGDKDLVSFTRDAVVRLIVRRPLTHDFGFQTYDLPFSGGDVILFHSARRTLDDSPTFGNFVSGAVVPYSIVPSLFSAAKDVSESFHDEVYRYNSNWWDATSTPIADAPNLLGPGLPAGIAPLDVPVRPFSAISLGMYQDASWLIQGFHLSDLSTGAEVTELQVSGLPRRNPPINDGSYAPFPPAGMCLYPQFDYTASYRPNNATDGVTQFDYTTCSGDRSYVRAFDIAFSRGTPRSVVGTNLVKLRIKGIELSDIAYTGGSPGGAGIAILVKVPGLTTWMDVGRPDGAGPSKQDMTTDGAGCQIVGTDTFDAVDSTYKYTYCQVSLYVGPVAAFFANSDGEVPLLVKVVLKDNATGKGLDFDQGEFLTTADCRGLIGIEVV
jgi:hypothetical protein